MGQKNDTAAEPLLTSGYQGIHDRIDKIADDDKPLVKKAIQQIIQLYETTKQSEKASQWKEKLNEFEQADASPQADQKASSNTSNDH